MDHIFPVSSVIQSISIVLYAGIFVPSDSKEPLRLPTNGKNLMAKGDIDALEKVQKEQLFYRN